MRLPPVLDVEWNGGIEDLPLSALIRRRSARRLQRFMDRLEAYYGKRPIIYTSVDFHRDNLVGYFQDYHFWVRSVAKHPEVTYADRRWAFWQYTSTGVIPGIKGPTDINVFAGSAKNWNNWAAAVLQEHEFLVTSRSSFLLPSQSSGTSTAIPCNDEDRLMHRIASQAALRLAFLLAAGLATGAAAQTAALRECTALRSDTGARMRRRSLRHSWPA